jgi:nicotinamidase-related amidase
MHKANAALSQLVLVDMQVKLAPAMPAEAMQTVTKNCVILAQAASLLNIPSLLTEHYPQGLGATLPEIMQHLSNTKIIAKTAFSACGEPKFNQQLQRENSHIILVGMEAHICVLQTALDLIEAGKTVFVVEDAIISRVPSNKANAIARLRDAGCVITNTESVLFEWMGNAKHAAAKAIFSLVK